MRRADRLFRLIERLRGGKLVTARRLAEALEVSERTIYRDMRDLMASGVPIEGEAGMGYVLRSGFDLPPLMFDPDELEAMVLGLRMASAWGGTKMDEAAERSLRKIEAVLPPRLRDRMATVRLHAPGHRVPPELRALLDRLHAAITTGRRVGFEYVDQAGVGTRRGVRPLGLFFWGGVWTLAAWCELREDFRSFRVDRMVSVEVTEAFAADRMRGLDAYLRVGYGRELSSR